MCVSDGQSIRPFLARLEREGSLLRIDKAVDRCFELSAFLSAADAGPALMFDRIAGSGLLAAGDLEREGSLLRIDKAVDRCFELSAFLSAADAGPALMFDRIEGSGLRAAGN